VESVDQIGVAVGQRINQKLVRSTAGDCQAAFDHAAVVHEVQRLKNRPFVFAGLIVAIAAEEGVEKSVGAPFGVYDVRELHRITDLAESQVAEVSDGVTGDRAAGLRNGIDDLLTP